MRFFFSSHFFAGLLLLFVAFVTLAAFSACVHKRGDATAGIEVLRSGGFVPPDVNADIAGVVYVNVRDKSDMVFGLRAKLETSLAESGFSVTSNPSKAGYIVHPTVLAVGAAEPDSLRAMVNEGYGGTSRLSGTGATTLLTDVLLVQRRVPTSGRKNLQNISNRNAVAESRMRLALLSRREIRFNAGVPEYVMDVLVRELCASVSAVHMASR
ncbi:complement resistance protein TraT [Candidatus Desulfovibrio trichonymphae]|uniref:Uncharacterized protein n=1 Tax=Candidatus Desulfovibrio trichonymphae TaxID=1725232 RepID=A0A1J1E2R0_9BACT|nr:complement resistance protein TraT [Candidatus Desulfovibrio trichonymphae]BAV92163.1 conserved hypothetical protein [Candidatus Desulfovibrio trichonymphae]GHU92134.1 hypothetical protein AGMMS49925_09600 [Deltaproteobacteria bacterium]GHU98829.1 hypothetical protein AGMMS50248_06010 [Deltaproteobacteria bacterium]